MVVSGGSDDGRVRSPDARRVPDRQVDGDGDGTGTGSEPGDEDRESGGGGRLQAGLAAGFSTKPVLAGFVLLLAIMALLFLLAGLVFLAQFLL